MADAPELRVHDDADASIEHRNRRLVSGAQAHAAKEEGGVPGPQWPDDEVAAGEDTRTHVQRAAQPDPEIQTQADLNKDKQTFETLAGEDSAGTRDKHGGRESSILAAVYELSSLFEPHNGVEGALSTSSSLAESTSICFSPW
jgi:hypothetical protein